jgi:predicted tellurium resistance membrane protein TerC
MAITQIVLIDVVFSFDSILTALGLTEHIPIIIAAVCVSMLVMLLASKPVGEFVERHLSIKLLALAFLLVIGVVLIADGLHVHIPKPYIYSALAFSMFVQALVMWASHRRTDAPDADHDHDLPAGGTNSPD